MPFSIEAEWAEWHFVLPVIMLMPFSIGAPLLFVHSTPLSRLQCTGLVAVAVNIRPQCTGLAVVAADFVTPLSIRATVRVVHYTVLFPQPYAHAAGALVTLVSTDAPVLLLVVHSIAPILLQ